MKVFFVTSPRIKQKYPQNIAKIYSMLEELGCTHVNNFMKAVKAEDFYDSDVGTVKNQYKMMVEGIKKAEVVVLEASMHSLAVGYLVNLALEAGKPAIVLFTEESGIPFLFDNIQNDKLIVIPYTLGNLRKNLEEVLEEASNQMDMRFNFFVSPKIVNYLDWISKKKKMPRAVYLRHLIEKDMEKSKEFDSESE